MDEFSDGKAALKKSNNLQHVVIWQISWFLCVPVLSSAVS